MKTKIIFSLLFAVVCSALFSGFVGASAAIITESTKVFLPVAAGLFVASFVFKPKQNYAYMAFTMGLCEKIQTSLIEIYGSNAPSLKRSNTGFIDALTSSINTAGFTKIQVGGGTGKIRQTKVKAIQRGCNNTTTDPFDCDIDITPEPFEDIVSITQFRRTKGIGFNVSDMRLICEGGAEYRAAQVNAQINQLMVDIDKDLIALQAANFGDIPGYGAGAKTYYMLKGPESTPIFLGESELMEDSENMESGDKPIVIGAGNLAHYVRQVGIGCCNDSGIDLSQAGNLNYFRDQNVETILGPNHFIGMIPGYTQLLTWNENVGEFFKEVDDLYSNGTIVDPRTGLLLDMNWTYDICLKKYMFQLGVHFELYHIPDNAFAACDVLNGVNFTFHGIVANITGTGS